MERFIHPHSLAGGIIAYTVILLINFITMKHFFFPIQWEIIIGFTACIMIESGQIEMAFRSGKSYGFQPLVEVVIQALILTIIFIVINDLLFPSHMRSMGCHTLEELLNGHVFFHFS